MLAGDQPRHQHDPSIGKFQRVVMHARLVHVDLAEAGHARRHGFASHAEDVVELDVARERELGARQQADRHIRRHQPR